MIKNSYLTLLAALSLPAMFLLMACRTKSGVGESTVSVSRSADVNAHVQTPFEGLEVTTERMTMEGDTLVFRLQLCQQTGYDDFRVWGVGENVFVDDLGVRYTLSTYQFDDLSTLWCKIPMNRIQNFMVRVPGINPHAHTLVHAKIQLRAVWTGKDVRGNIFFANRPLDMEGNNQ